MNHFFAISLPKETALELAEFVECWKPRLPADLIVRWVEPESYHITLNFLGNLSRTVQPRLIKAVASVPYQFAPFNVNFSFTGAFESAASPGILWAGLNQKRETTRLSKSIDHALSEHKFAIEPHSYVPHTTLGRCRAKRQEDIPPPIRVGQPINLEMLVTGFVLMQTLPPESRAKDSNARYNIVHTFPFGRQPEAQGEIIG